jgi:hypothetical protein
MDGIGDGGRNGGGSKSQAKRKGGGWHVNLFKLKWTAIVQQIVRAKLPARKYF